MADLWLGFERDQIRNWFDQAELVNVIVDCTGESCQAECESEEGERADVSIFVAAGTKRVHMRESVQESYCSEGVIRWIQPRWSLRVRLRDSSCCSPGVIKLEDIDTVEWNTNYSATELKEVPSEAARNFARLRQSHRHGRTTAR